ncbi:MAG: iron-containing alcohol dehydrogenase [Desulfobacterales bacterium]|nr:iron-containing alcohol dehydrogenase [Desulfobacterales bacterium]
MSNFRFHCPVKIVSGEHALDKLPGEFKQLGAKRPLIVTDGGVAKAGLLDLVQESFDASELGICGIYDRVPPDSPISAIHEIVAQYQQNHCDSLLAIGGGSTIDTAKGVKIKLADPAIDVMNFKAVLRMVKPTCPLIVIPTTAGTGSEVTSAAVISDPDKGIKLSLISPAMPPNTAIIDPRMTATLPPRLTASTGMDALTHAVEACLGTQKNPISDAVAGQAITLIAENLVEAVQHGLNLHARLGMANAATLAGIAFSNSMVTIYRRRFPGRTAAAHGRRASLPANAAGTARGAIHSGHPGSASKTARVERPADQLERCRRARRSTASRGRSFAFGRRGLLQSQEVYGGRSAIGSA